MTNEYLKRVYASVEARDGNEPEFLQAVREVFESLAPVINKNEKLYEQEAILERITEPDRQIQFRVPRSEEHTSELQSR